MTLTKTEKKVLKLILKKKMTAKEAALSLDVSPRTIEMHLLNVYRKFHVSSKEELLAKIPENILN